MQSSPSSLLCSCPNYSGHKLLTRASGSHLYVASEWVSNEKVAFVLMWVHPVFNPGITGCAHFLMIPFNTVQLHCWAAHLLWSNPFYADSPVKFKLCYQLLEHFLSNISKSKSAFHWFQSAIHCMHNFKLLWCTEERGTLDCTEICC